MNNAKIILKQEEVIDRKPYQRQRQSELVGIIEAIRHIQGSSYWKLLEEKVWKGVVDSLNRQLWDVKDEKEMWRLQGQVAWANKYADLGTLVKFYENELATITNQINAKN